jgi:hypothetical protein
MVSIVSLCQAQGSSRTRIRATLRKVIADITRARLRPCRRDSTTLLRAGASLFRPASEQPTTSTTTREKTTVKRRTFMASLYGEGRHDRGSAPCRRSKGGALSRCGWGFRRDIAADEIGSGLLCRRAEM